MKIHHRPARPSGGFTIIEVLIVLAIAGLIMLIVFQAIPTLQRNSRNSQRANDVAAILEAVSHYELNNSGNFPGSGSNFLQYTKLNYYQTNTFYDAAGPDEGVYMIGSTNLTAKGNLSPVTELNKVYVYNYQQCSRNADGSASSATAGYFDVVALYALEASNNQVRSQCQRM